MAHAVPPPAVHMTASQMKATARVQSEAMFEALKAAKLHTAMTDALLTLYETGTHHPSEMLDEMVHLLGRKRTPPVPSSLRLPLRSKAEYLRALDASSISAALRTVVAELDQMRRAGEPLPSNVVAFAKERLKAWSTAKKKEARKRAAAAAAAIAVLEPPPPRAPRAVASKVASTPPRAAAPPPEPRRSIAEAERLAPAGSVSSDDADEARAEALAEVSAAAFALEAAEAAAAEEAGDEDDVDALAAELAAEALEDAQDEEDAAADADAADAAS